MTMCTVGRSFADVRGRTRLWAEAPILATPLGELFDSADVESRRAYNHS